MCMGFHCNVLESSFLIFFSEHNTGFELRITDSAARRALRFNICDNKTIKTI